MAASPAGTVNLQDGPAAAGHDVAAYFVAGHATSGCAAIVASNRPISALPARIGQT